MSGAWSRTRVDLQPMVPLQSEDQRVGSRAEDLPRGKVHAVVHLEVEATRQSAYTQRVNTGVSPSFIHTLPANNKTYSPLCTNISCLVCM